MNKTEVYGLITHIDVRKHDVGMLYDLRKGIHSHKKLAMYKHIIPLLSKRLNTFEETYVYFVAALFGYHPNNIKDYKSIGYIIKKLGDSYSDERFTKLLNSEDEILFKHIFSIVSICKSKNIPIDYANLLWHLLHWNSDSNWVQKRIAEDKYSN